MKTSVCSFSISFLIFFTNIVLSQSLKLEDIMKGEAFIGHQPYNPRFSFDGEKLYFDWNKNNELEPSTYYYNKEGKPVKCDANLELESQLNYIYNKSNNIVFYVNGEAIYKRNFGSKTSNKIFQIKKEQIEQSRISLGTIPL